MRRRRRLVLVWTAVSLLSAAAGGMGVWALRGDTPAPVIPGDRGIRGLTDRLRREIPPDAPVVAFSEVAEASGIACNNFEARRSRVLPEDMASGCAWFDADQDGDLDLFVVRMEPLDPAKAAPGAARGHALYRNDGTGRFTDVSVTSGVAIPAHGQGVAAGDIDDDGDLDLFVTCFGGDQLFRNRGDGTFDECAGECGVSDDAYSSGAAFADYDQDGDLDLYVTGYVKFRDDPALRGHASSQYGRQIPFSLNPSSYAPGGGRLLRNDGRGRFEDVTTETHTGNEKGRGLSVAFTDLDGDLLPDIYVANDVSDNVLYWNLGGGRFQDVSYASGTADHRGAMGLAIGDYDGDLDTDIFITHWIAQENALYENITSTLPESRPSSSPTDGLLVGPLFTDVADRRGVGAIALDYVGWGCAFTDLDLDGRLDIFVVNGHTMEVSADVSSLEPQRFLVFWNGGRDRGFFEIGAHGGEALQRRHVGRGAAFADFDGDGDEDAYVVVLGAKGLLLRNDFQSAHHWLAVSVRQPDRNRFGVGATIRVTAGGTTQTRTIGAQPSYLSSNPLEARFGLGMAARAERIEVVFPDGSTQVLNDAPADRAIVVTKETRGAGR